MVMMTIHANKKKMVDALKNVDSFKASYTVGKWEIVSTKEELRYMPDDIWMKYSKIGRASRG